MNQNQQAQAPEHVVAFRTIVSTLNAISQSGKGIIPNLRIASNVWNNIVMVDDFITNELSGKTHSILPGTIKKQFGDFTGYIDKAYEAGVFQLRECNVIMHAVEIFSTYLGGKIQEHAKKQKEEIDARNKTKQDKLVKINEATGKGSAMKTTPTITEVDETPTKPIEKPVEKPVENNIVQRSVSPSPEEDIEIVSA